MQEDPNQAQKRRENQKADYLGEERESPKVAKPKDLERLTWWKVAHTKNVDWTSIMCKPVSPSPQTNAAQSTKVRSKAATISTPPCQGLFPGFVFHGDGGVEAGK